jgi:hypothetical protein
MTALCKPNLSQERQALERLDGYLSVLPLSH